MNNLYLAHPIQQPILKSQIFRGFLTGQFVMGWLVFWQFPIPFKDLPLIKFLIITKLWILVGFYNTSYYDKIWLILYEHQN